MRIIIILLLAFTFACSSNVDQISEINTEPIVPEVIIPEPVYEYGFCIDSFQVNRGQIEENWTLSHLLLPYNLGQFEVNQADLKAKDSCVGLKYISKGHDYLVLSGTDSAAKAQYCIYDKNPYEYVVFDFTDSVNVYKVERKINYDEKSISGVILQGSNLSNEVQNATENINITAELVTNIAGAFAWSIDFFKLHAQDKFKAIYDEKSVEGKSYGMGELSAIFFEHKEKQFYAFQYEIDGNKAYYDQDGNSMKSMFLKAPLKYSRISSPYQKKRFHPVQKRYKAHLGTDYAAPKNTPIWSTANGTVIAARFSKYNGYFVKVRHNSTYTTQYLHMTKIAPGMKKGVSVSQGQTIGYVGSTGLATGPHVCYRFWKNDKQVDPRNEVFEIGEPLDEEVKKEYLKFIAPLKLKIDAIPFSQVEPVTSDSLRSAVQ